MDRSSSDEIPKTETPTLDTGSRQPTNNENVTVDPQIAVVELSNVEPPRDDGEENGVSAVLQQLASESELFKPQPAADVNLVVDTAQLRQDAWFDDSERAVLDRPDPGDQHFKNMPKHHGPFEIMIRYRDGRNMAATKIACFFNLAAKSGHCVVALTVFHLLTDHLLALVYNEMIQNKKVENLPERLSPPKHIKVKLEGIISREYLHSYLFDPDLAPTEVKDSVKWYIAILNQLLADGAIDCQILEEQGRTNTFNLKGSSFRYALPYSDSNTNFDALLVELRKRNGDPLDEHDMEALKHEMCGADIYKVVDCEEFSHEKAREHSEIDPDNLQNRWWIKGSLSNPVNLQSGPLTQDLSKVPLYIPVPGDQCDKIMQFVFKHGSSITNAGDSGRGIFIFGKSGSKHFSIVAMMTHTCKNSREHSYCQPVHMLAEQFKKHEMKIVSLDIIGKLDTPTNGH